MYDKFCTLKRVLKAALTEDLCLAAVKETCWALEFVPDELKTKAVCLAAVNDKTAKKEHFNVLRFVPEEMMTEALCIAAIRKNGLSLSSVPYEMRTVAVCLAAVDEDLEENIIFIPRELQDKVSLAIADDA